jgi:hypothetical protein
MCTVEPLRTLMYKIIGGLRSTSFLFLTYGTLSGHQYRTLGCPRPCPKLLQSASSFFQLY